MWYYKVERPRPQADKPLFQMVESTPTIYYPSAIERQRIADGTPMTYFSPRNQVGRPEQTALTFATINKSSHEEAEEEKEEKETVEKSIDANAVLRRFLGR